MTTDECVFCQIVKGTVPADKVAESEHALAFRDVAPQAPVHVLIIPKRHFTSMNELPDGSVVGAMTMLAKQVAKELELAEKGYRVVINTGKHGGQTVDHIHLHLLGGRKMKWPPG
ncbi:MAG: histidine triad nucleotide-binding protein [Gemmatimonadaceae bacterium]